MSPGDASGPPPGATGPLAGRVLGGHYVLGERIGAGSMGVVHRARHTLLQREFAVKVLAPALAGDPEARRRFHREAEGLARITHPGVVPVRHFGEEDGVLFLVMDLAEGETLHDLLAREGPLPERRAADIALQVLQALDAAHWEGVVHRDLKPSNVLLSPAAGGRGGDRVRVLDFGLARVIGAAPLPGAGASAPGAVAGTVAYMSPEQVRGAADIDGRSDLFSLGAVMHEMLGGRPPFEGTSTLTVAMKILEQPPPPLPEEGPRGVSAPVRAVLARALEKDREMRFRTAGEMADALREALAGVAPAGAAAPPGSRPRRLLFAAGAAAAVVLAALAAGPLLGDRAPAEPSYDAARAAGDRDLALRSFLDARFETAAGALGRVLAAGPGTAEDHLLRGRCRAALGDEGALEDLARVEALLPGDPRPVLERARFLLEVRQDPDGAGREIERVLARGRNADATFEWARLASIRVGGLRHAGAGGGEFEGILARFATAAEAMGEDPRRGIVESLEAEARGDFEGSRELAERAAARAPDLAEDSFQVAHACSGLGYRARLPEDLELARRWHGAALRATAEAVARARRRPDLLLQGRNLLRYLRSACNSKYSLGDLEGAASDFLNEVLSRNPGNRFDLGVSGQYLQWAGRFEEALRAYAAAGRAGFADGYFHGEAFCHAQLGRVKAEGGDLPGALRELDAAVTTFTRGLEKHPANASYRAYRAEAWLTRARLQREEAAAEALARAREDFDALAASEYADDPEILFRRWEYHEVTRDAAGALAAIRTATASGRNLTPAYYRRLAYSCILAASGPGGDASLLEEAVRAADAAERWNPEKAELSFLLRGEARVRQAEGAATPDARGKALAAARGDFARAATLARPDPRVQAEAHLRAARVALLGGDAALAVREAEEALRLRREANARGRSSLFIDDYYLRSPLADYHLRLAEALSAAGRAEDAARERARGEALR